MGSRMLDEGGARAGGMPLYKFVGNRILTTAQNRLVGASLSEWHSGYRAYRVRAPRDARPRRHVGRLRLRHADPAAAHRPWPPDHRDPDPDLLRRRDLLRQRACGTPSDIMGHTVRHRLRRMGFGTRTGVAPATSSRPATARRTRCSPTWSPTGRHCGSSISGVPTGRSAPRCSRRGHEVVGVDATASAGRARAPDAFVAGRSRRRPPCRSRRAVRRRARRRRARAPPRARASCWSRSVTGCSPAAASSAASRTSGTGTHACASRSGRFDYDARGILDRGHVRFFTRRSFRRHGREGRATASSTGENLGLPVEVFARGGSRTAWARCCGRGSPRSTGRPSPSGRRCSPISSRSRLVPD